MLVEWEKKSFQVPAKTVKGAWWISQLVWQRVPGHWASYRKGLTTEHWLSVLWYKQLMAASGPHMLPTSNVWGVDAAVHDLIIHGDHVLWCSVLQTSMDHCTQPVLHPLRNAQPVQLDVQEMAESVVILPQWHEWQHSVLAGACLWWTWMPQREWHCNSPCVTSQKRGPT